LIGFRHIWRTGHPKANELSGDNAERVGYSKPIENATAAA